MAKRNEPAVTDLDDDALFAPGSWDVGPPSVRRVSVRPGRRSKRPPAEALGPEPAAAPPALPQSPVVAAQPVTVAVEAAPAAATPKTERTAKPERAVKPQRAAAVKSKSDRTTPAPSTDLKRANPAPSAKREPFFPPLASKSELVEPAPVPVCAPEAVVEPAVVAAAPPVTPAAPELEIATPPELEIARAPALAFAAAPEIELSSEPLKASDLASAVEAEPDSVSGARLVHPSRRAPSATASFRPVVPASKPAPQRRTTLVSRLPLVSLLLSSVGIGFLLFGGRPAAAPAESMPRAASEEPASARAQRPEPVRAAAVLAPQAPQSPATRAGEPPVAAQPAAPAPVEAVGAVAASAPALAATTTTVELTVYPLDAAVGYLGIMQKGGQPYKFEIPEGTKIAVEVARRGYGTRKVMIDGSTPKLSIGLRKTHTGE